MACRDLTLGERPCCRVQSLTRMCTDALVEVIEHVESLWGLPDAIKVGGPLAPLRGPCCAGGPASGTGQAWQAFAPMQVPAPVCGGQLSGHLQRHSWARLVTVLALLCKLSLPQGLI